jgi:hypothetical protein
LNSWQELYQQIQQINLETEKLILKTFQTFKQPHYLYINKRIDIP